MVAAGVTATEPEFGVTLPIPGAIVTEVAFCVCHVKVELWPAVIAAGLAVNCTMVGADEFGVVVVTEVDAVPLSPSVFVTVKRKL